VKLTGALRAIWAVLRGALHVAEVRSGKGPNHVLRTTGKLTIKSIRSATFSPRLHRFKARVLEQGVFQTVALKYRVRLVRSNLNTNRLGCILTRVMYLRRGELVAMQHRAFMEFGPKNECKQNVRNLRSAYIA
jgi:hypothetical protein